MTKPFLPLEGIRVVDVSHVIAGPFATFHLALLGADVLKIESPDGDVMRRGARGPKAFVALNAGKRKVRLDLKSAEGKARALAEVAGADVFVDNLRPGAAEKLGLGWEALKAINPQLVYCSISGFGREAGRSAYDHVVQVATGMTLASGNEGEPPQKIGFPLIDAAAGIVAALAIVSALRERDRRGAGMLVDVSMAGAALQLMYPLTCEALTDGVRPVRQGNQAFSGSPAADLFPTRGGGQIAFAANTPRQFLALLAVLGLDTLASDPELFEKPLTGSQPAAFLKSRDPALVKARIGARTAELDGEQLERRLVEARVPVALVRPLDDFARHAADQGWIKPIVLEEDGVRVISPGLGFKVS